MGCTSVFKAGQTEPYNWLCQSLQGTRSLELFGNLFGFTKPLCVENQITEIAGEIILKEVDQVLRSKELELSQVEIEVQSLRIVAELLGEEADEEARKLADAFFVRDQH
jgi:hypothetical protein